MVVMLTGAECGEDLLGVVSFWKDDGNKGVLSQSF
jgi:hypothetical protein